MTATSKRCAECRTVFEHPQQYRYQNGWREKPVCRNQDFCRPRKAHQFRPCRVSTPEGMFFTCGFVGCGTPSHATRAALI